MWKVSGTAKESRVKIESSFFGGVVHDGHMATEVSSVWMYEVYQVSAGNTWSIMLCCPRAGR